ncbi:putative transcriptional regulator [Bifidobacterium actinocoloniiforme DSM 22766]|uniref:Putative transcriptional regulator n=2 Tax=Bifidobacterium actinocoloniiforme TaxID=638619 RepID=A0A086Z2J1_9BIFI|nr:putative transcriptional regulator [Bifidobacterium actinocoloniiforme DSM 22766]
MVGYRGKSSTNKNPLVSSTCLLRRQGRIVGALCINSDRTPLVAVEHMVGQLKEMYFPSADYDNIHQQEENLVASVGDIVSQVIDGVCVETGLRVDQLGTERRLDVMKRLNDRGCFNIKGSVARVAKQLAISESTAYRYIHMVTE